MGWFLFAMGAMISFALLFLLIKKIGNLGVRSDLLLLYYFGFATIMLLVYLISFKVPLSITKYALILLIIAAIFGVIGNVFLVQSIKISPNPGYALAISGVHILLVAVAAIFIFKSEFTLIKGLGTILTVLGIILLGWK